MMTVPKLRFVRRFAEVTLDDIAHVGGKNASLGELYRALRPMGVPVPNGFAVTTDAYRYVLTQGDAWGQMQEVLRALDIDDAGSVAACARRLRGIVGGAPLPSEIEREIHAAYEELKAEYGPELTVAVRSSATAEDLPSASFAGQHESYLNVRGAQAVINAYRKCLASLFTDRAIHYRADNGVDHLEVALSVGIMKMVRSDIAASGVAFTLDTESGFRDVVLINASYGLGENVVQGAVEPDELYVHKPTFEAGFRAVLRRKIGSKRVKMVYAEQQAPEATRNVPTTEEERDRQCISDDDALTIARYAIAVEHHYGERTGASQPMDLEWAKDGLDGRIYLVQARPETVISRRALGMLEEYRIDSSKARLLLTGRAVGGKAATGAVRVIREPGQVHAFQAGEILVAETTTPDWEPVMKIAAAVITNSGGRTCHAAIVAREIGIPAVVGAENATELLSGVVTVSCAEGDVGKIYAGAVPFIVKRTDVGELRRPDTKVMITIADPGAAFTTAGLPNDGVGLARIEFVIANEIGAHPMALAHPERVSDPTTRATLQHLARRHASPSEFFVERLSEGVGTIAAAFHPKPVVVRMSDFKTNEYAHLLGGAAFEPMESNPMLGLRGASRYTHPMYADGFALECAAMRRVRETMGLRNVILMIPFCRRPDEARRVIDAMAAHGLVRGRQGLQIYVMCEIPNNVLQIDAFSEFFDGFSIGSNDLTQLVLGVDRDSASVAFAYDERDQGVLTMLGLAVQGAKRNGRYSGICGQAPSDYPEIAEYLVDLGIDSISLNPDSVVRTTLRILEIEKRRASSVRGAAS